MSTPPSSSRSQTECRICFGEKGPFIRPCDCKGSIASVHPQCIKYWLSLKTCATCELCGVDVKTEMTLRPFRVIAVAILKKLWRQLTHDKFTVFKALIWTAYIYIFSTRIKRGIMICMDMFKKKYESQGLAVVSVLYLVAIFI